MKIDSGAPVPIRFIDVRNQEPLPPPERRPKLDPEEDKGLLAQREKSRGLGPKALELGPKAAE